MDQAPLFVEDVSDAYRATVQRLGGFKKVGAELRPELDPEKAGEWLRNCLDRGRREVLNPDYCLEVKRMARQAGCHIIEAYEHDYLGYRAPEPIEPVDEIAELQKAFIQSVDDNKRLLERLEQAQLRLGRRR